MNDSTCNSDSCQCAPAPATQQAPVSKAEPQWRSRKIDDGAVVEIALPGVSREALELTTGGGFLKLKASRKAGEGQFLRGSAAPDAYELSLRLAANLDGGHANAKFEDGLLTVTLPLAESAKPRRIEVG